MQILTNTKETLSTTTTTRITSSTTPSLNQNDNLLEFNNNFKHNHQKINSTTTSIDDFNCYNLIKDELKYMKGYVNVLKERFSRGRLQNTTNSNANHVVDTLIASTTQSSQTQQDTPIELKQHQQQQISSTTPLRTRTHLKHTRVFASQENLNPLKFQQDPSIPPPPPPPLASTQKKVIIKCTYSNEINTDEFPKPNFVSSVKNLFERKTNSNTNQHVQVVLTQTLNPKSKSTSTRNSAPPCIENADFLIDKLKQHGTIVYDHQASTKQVTSLASTQSTTPVPPLASLTGKTVRAKNHADEKALSVRERKEIFNKKPSPNSTSNTTTLSPPPTLQPSIPHTKVDVKHSKSSIDEVTLNQNSINAKDELTESDSFNINQVLIQQRVKLKQKSQVKTKTFYGGQEVNDIKSIPSPLAKTSVPLSPPQETKVEFLNAEIKLSRPSLLSSNTNKTVKKRVNFDDQANTYEYPSYEFMLKELGIDPSLDSDYNDSLNQVNNCKDDQTNDNYNENDIKFNSGTNQNVNFNNFKPAWYQRDYQLGNCDTLQKEISNNLNKGQQQQQYQQHDDLLTNDILPMNDDETKRWSTDIDANILF